MNPPKGFLQRLKTRRTPACRSRRTRCGGRCGVSHRRGLAPMTWRRPRLISPLRAAAGVPWRKNAAKAPPWYRRGRSGVAVPLEWRRGAGGVAAAAGNDQRYGLYRGVSPPPPCQPRRQLRRHPAAIPAAPRLRPCHGGTTAALWRRFCATGRPRRHAAARSATAAAWSSGPVRWSDVSRNGRRNESDGLQQAGVRRVFNRCRNPFGGFIPTPLRGVSPIFVPFEGLFFQMY